MNYMLLIVLPPPNKSKCIAAIITLNSETQNQPLATNYMIIYASHLYFCFRRSKAEDCYCKSNFEGNEDHHKKVLILNCCVHDVVFYIHICEQSVSLFILEPFHPAA